jgi:hypothetical protein
VGAMNQLGALLASEEETEWAGWLLRAAALGAGRHLARRLLSPVRALASGRRGARALVWELGAALPLLQRDERSQRALHEEPLHLRAALAARQWRLDQVCNNNTLLLLFVVPL